MNQVIDMNNVANNISVKSLEIVKCTTCMQDSY